MDPNTVAAVPPPVLALTALLVLLSTQIKAVECLRDKRCQLSKKRPRTRTESRFAQFYSHMRDDEFRAVFRLPRALFDAILEDIRPEIEYRYTCATRVFSRFPMLRSSDADCDFSSAFWFFQKNIIPLRVLGASSRTIGTLSPQKTCLLRI